MRNYLIIGIIFSLLHLHFAPLCLANEVNKVKLEAEKVDKSALIGEVDKLIFKKYIAVKLELSSKNDKEISIPGNIYYICRKTTYRAPSYAVIYGKTKRHTVIRGFVTTIAVFPLIICLIGIPIVAGTVAYSSTSNGNLEDNIKKNIFKPKHLFSDDYYSTYIFIPKKHRKVSEVFIKNVSDGEKTFDLRSPVTDNL